MCEQIKLWKKSWANSRKILVMTRDVSWASGQQIVLWTQKMSFVV